ncbi:hypothetical protein J3458_021433 [Metarhizium acridum]|nr:hypothetical protein J3458_021433 [Metarhizium acridum]
MSFRNQRYDRQRGLFHDKYKEYMERDDFDAQKSAAERMATAMNRVANNGARYEADQTINLYPALGSTDEAMAGYYNQTCGANRIHALTFEFGQSRDCNDIFYPDARQYRDNIIHTNVGLMELLLNAAEKGGKSKIYECKNEQGTPEQQQSSPTPSPSPQDGCLATTQLSRQVIEACNAKGRNLHYEGLGRTPFQGREACDNEGWVVVNRCREEAKQSCQQKPKEPQQEPPKPDQQNPKDPQPSLTQGGSAS